MLLLLLMMMMMMMKVTFVMLLLLCVTVSYHQHHVFGCKHHTLDCTNRVAGVLADGVQVHSALECHKTRWADHVHVTVKRDVVLELIT